MRDDAKKLTPADASDIAESVAHALLFSGRKRVHDSDRMMASIAAQHIVRHLEKCGFVVMKRPPIGGSAPLNPPASWPHTKLFFAIEEVHDRVSDIEKTYHAGTTTELSSIIQTPPHLC
jgi:hypothetical protein